MTTQTTIFEHAARYEPELSDRQREVLRLMVAGKTNPEIAEALGVTLAGAKWHVSEILTKLGLESREDVIAYQRWAARPQRRLRRFARGLVALPLAKAVGGAALSVAVVVGGVGAWVFATQDTGAQVSVQPRPFYLEATVTQGPVEGGEQRAVVRWWYRDEHAWRWEYDVLTPESYTQSGWLEDGMFYRYDGRTNSYSVDPVATFAAGASPRWWAPWIAPGWFGTALPATTVNEFQAWWEAIAAENTDTVSTKVVGREIVLGREATVIEVTTARREPEAGFEIDPGNGRPVQDANGKAKRFPVDFRSTMRFWIDAERMMLLQFTSTDTQAPPSQPSGLPFRMGATVTRLDYDVALTAAELESDIPAGALPGLQP